jgi:uncharacterized membrane protein
VPTADLESEPLEALAAKLARIGARVNPALTHLQADRQTAVGKVMADVGLKAPAVADGELPRLINEGQTSVRALLPGGRSAFSTPSTPSEVGNPRLHAGDSGLELIVIGYDNRDQAVAAYDEVLAMQDDFVVELQGLAIVTVDEEGKSHVETPQKIVGMSAASGALWGMLLGLLFFVPFFGLALGGLMGALFGKLGKSGINDEFRSQVNGMLEPGKAAVVIMASSINDDKFAHRMNKYRGKLLKTWMSADDEKELAHELGEVIVSNRSF